MQLMKVEIFLASNGFFLYLYQNDGSGSEPSSFGMGGAPQVYMSPSPPVPTGGPGGRGMKVITEVYESVDRLFNRLRELLVVSQR